MDEINSEEKKEAPEPHKSPLNQNAGCGGCLMVGAFAIIMMIIIIKSISPTPPPTSEAPPPVPASNAWYQGGNLHKSTDNEWLAATPENRLATSSDFVAAAKDRFQFKNMDELKAYSIRMNACITEAAKAKAGQQAPDLAAVCALSLTN